MKTVSWLLVGSIVAMGLVVCPACDNQKAKAPKTYPASVKLTYHGKPLEKANVTLIPQQQGGTGASGVTDANGVAKLALPGLADGAVPGKYFVTVSKVEGGASDPNMTQEEFYKQQKAKSGAPPSSPKQVLPVKFLSAQASGLQCEVTDKADQVFEFNLGD